MTHIANMLNAAHNGDLEAMEELLANGHSVNEKNFDNVTALHEACFAGQLETVHFLLRRGANVNARNIDGATPLCDACSNGSLVCVKTLLANGADVNPKLSFYTTPLHEAVFRADHCDVVQLLIDNGANLEANDCHFGQPLHVAAARGHTASARLLLKAGARVNAHHRLKTALHMAAANNNKAFAEQLLEFGADVFAEDNNSFRPRSIVSSDAPLYNILLEYESNVTSLCQLCRLTIRQLLQRGSLDRSLNHLELPTMLKNYLLYH